MDWEQLVNEGQLDLFGEEGPWRASDGADWWRLAVAHGGDLDLEVRSSAQRPPRVEVEGQLVTLVYEGLVAVDNQDVPVTFAVTCEKQATGYVLTSRGRSSGSARVNEVTLPLITSGLRDDEKQETLYRPLGLGQRIANPRVRAQESHTEYMAGDHRGIWDLAAYPGELSMPWQCLEADGWILYLGRHDGGFSSTIFRFGAQPRQQESADLLQGVVTPISPTESGDFTTPPVVLDLRRGDWRDAVAIYRAWAETWYTGPASGGRLDLAGWQRVIMKHQYGEIMLRYEDLLEVYEAGTASGIDTIMLFGWWKGCFDRSYPVYEPDPELGGTEELNAVIRTIEERGGRVFLYANGNLIDRASDWYKDDASQSTRKGFRGIETTLGYPFSSQSAALRHFAGQEFVMGCHGTETWRATMTDVARTLTEQGSRHLFFDQVGYHLMAWPCTDSSHEHGDDWYGQEARLRAATIQQIRDELPGITFGSEGFVDNMVPQLDYHHGWGFAFRNEPEAFPQLFRSAFPEPVVTNRLIHDESSDWRQQLRYAFAFNLAFDIAIYRGRGDLRDAPDYAAEIRALTTLRQEFHHPLTSGHAECVSDGIGDDVIHMRFGDDIVADVVWNSGSEVRQWEDNTLPAGALLVRSDDIQRIHE